MKPYIVDLMNGDIFLLLQDCRIEYIWSRGLFVYIRSVLKRTKNKMYEITVLFARWIIVVGKVEYKELKVVTQVKFWDK